MINSDQGAQKKKKKKKKNSGCVSLSLFEKLILESEKNTRCVSSKNLSKYLNNFKNN